MESRKITAGPSKFDLMLSLFEKDKTVRCTVEGQEVEVTVLGIEAEDNSRGELEPRWLRPRYPAETRLPSVLQYAGSTGPVVAHRQITGSSDPHPTLVS